MALSPFLTKKFDYLFHQFYDSNKNGVITHSDFVDKIKGLQKFRHWPSSDDRLKTCKTTLNSAWNALKHTADANRDQKLWAPLFAYSKFMDSHNPYKVTLDEWFEYWSNFVAKSKQCDGGWPPNFDWIKDYIDFWFDLMDTSGDGYVDVNEYVQVCTHFGIAKDQSTASFKKLGQNAIDREQYRKLWLEYMTSEKDDSPGNFILGRTAW